ncbi:probable cytochrome P450 303a1 [Cylas formicarius]|uniref:probable cytochrome P450 303a1 n=1 Tax=Cylas formicarius TaxID=197179 RepID=UPI00295865C8|nr:probable cytochrome P450 303a1 [Cylas formicarius]
MWVALAVLFVAILAVLAYLDTRKPKGFPPGPRWYPLVGSAPQVKKARIRTGSLYEATAEMSKEYGAVIGLKVGKDPLVVVYGPQQIKEFGMSEDLIGRPYGSYFKLRTWGKRRGILLTDEAFWQEQKRFLLRQLREFGFGTKTMSSLIEDEVEHFVDYVGKCITKSGSEITVNMESFFSISILNTLWKMMAGIRYSHEDENLKRLQEILSTLFQTIHMVGAAFSHFPILKHIAPELSGYKCYVDTHERIWEFLHDEIQQHKKTHSPGDPRDLMDIYLDMLNQPACPDSFSEEQLLAICMDMFMAGSETTNNTLSFCFLYLILNPDIQSKAREEIDSVLGDRMPSLEDRSKMPYMECIVLESLRMFAARAFSVPHRAVKDTYLGGYFIPKDVLVTANLHGCMMSAEAGFKNPDQFIPERFLKDGAVSVPENFYPFGLGKRRCMGEYLARANIFLFATSLLQKFEFHVVPRFPPDMKIVDGVTPAPLHYQATIVFRQND